ncbi:hypothetical protein C2845_PM18G12410 [Panicum miliaceum]|uniref:Uncharacterized protein n=1 Tax=Panicum miliaceum TaxID=4540 RepID=A0A3L6PLM0_PANMI|nr:hypothetical protein C2845_PM18G12410 [Panicum miliaceum]
MAQLRVWVLDESDGNKTEWVLKHRSVVNPDYQQMRYDGPWTIADAYNKCIGTYDDESETEVEEASQEDSMEWNSDDDDIIDPADEKEHFYSGQCVIFLGFHPYKEVIFLRVMGNSGVVCHLDSGKVQYLAQDESQHGPNPVSNKGT